MWHAFRYLIAGRPKWDVAWFDLSIVPDPEAWLEEKLGPLEGLRTIIRCSTSPGKRHNAETISAYQVQIIQQLQALLTFWRAVMRALPDPSPVLGHPWHKAGIVSGLA